MSDYYREYPVEIKYVRAAYGGGPEGVEYFEVRVDGYGYSTAGTLEEAIKMLEHEDLKRFFPLYDEDDED